MCRNKKHISQTIRLNLFQWCLSKAFHTLKRYMNTLIGSINCTSWGGFAGNGHPRGKISKPSWRHIDVTPFMICQRSFCLQLTGQDNTRFVVGHVRGKTDMKDLSKEVMTSAKEPSFTKELYDKLEGPPSRGQISQYPILVGICHSCHDMDCLLDAGQ